MEPRQLLALTIAVGDHDLLPNTAGQVISIYVHGGDAVQGVQFNAQVADGYPKVPNSVTDGPDITSIDLTSTGTVFGAAPNGNSGTNRSTDSDPQIWIGGTTVNEDSNPSTTVTTPAEGLLAKLTISTIGWNAGSGPWDLKLAGTYNGSTNFQSPSGQIIPTITEGHLRIVQAPTLALTNTVTTLSQNATTTPRIKVADIVVTDDSSGTNVLGLTGADAALFEIAGNVLYLKAGTTLSHSANPTLDVTVTVDDATLGTTPDDSKSLSIAVTETAVDIRVLSAALNGGTQLALTYEISGGPIAAFPFSFYRSADAAFSSGDSLLDSVTIDAAADLSAGSHTKTWTIGSGSGEIALPGAGAEETSLDYFLLAVADPLNVVNESGVAGGETNNTVTLDGVYHAAAGPVMVHGTTLADVVQVLPGSVQVQLNGTSHTYTASDLTGVRVRGHAGDDQFQFTCGAGFGNTATLDFLFIGGAGANVATLTGSTSSTRDSASLTPSWGTLSGLGYSVLAKNTQQITVIGQGGLDKAILYDSALDDTFAAYPTYATLSNGQFTNRAENFAYVYAYATAQGTDTASFTAGTGNGTDQFSGSPTYAVMAGPTGSGGTYYNRAEGFEAMTGHSQDSEADVATLYDSASTSTTTQYEFVLDAAQRYGEVQAAGGATGSIRASHFRSTVAATRDQGADHAVLYGPTVSETAAATLYAKLSTKETWLQWPYGTSAPQQYFKYRASQVQHVEASASTGRSDTVLFYDSAGSDAFTGGVRFGQMVAPSGLSVAASNFRYVTAYSTNAGTDTAVLSGKAGTKDYFVGQATQATLCDDKPGTTGSSYFDSVVGFESVVASGGTGDPDQASLSGSTAQDTFTSDFYPKTSAPAERDPNRPYATLAGTGFSNTANSFRYVTASGAANDVAQIYAAAATHSLSANPTSTVLFSTNFYHEAKNFGEVHAHGVTGAKASLFDAALHVLLEAQASQAKLSNLDSTCGPFGLWAADFTTVNATATTGNAYAKKKVQSPTFALNLTGPWVDQ